MKLVTCLFILTGFLLVPCFAQTTGPQPSAADRFVERFSRGMEIIKMPLSAEQKEVLRTLHPQLVYVADHEIIRMGFWKMVRQSPTTKIEWAEAIELIQQGLASEVMQTHSRAVWIVTRDGYTYSTTEPRIDDVYRVIQEVDPKRVFISYGTE